MMIDFDNFLNALKSDLADLVKEEAGEIRDGLILDGVEFVAKAKEDLLRWTEQLADGNLTKEDFEWLLRSKKDLATMEALKQQGLAQTRIDKLKNALFDTIAGSVIGLLP